MGKFRINNEIENEFVSVFFTKSDEKIKPDKEEIEKIEYFDINFLKKEKNNMKMTPHCKKALDIVFERYF